MRLGSLARSRHPAFRAPRLPASRTRASTAPRCEQARPSSSTATTPPEAPTAAAESSNATPAGSNGANGIAGAGRTQLPLSSAGRDGAREASDTSNGNSNGNGNGNGKHGSTRLVKAADGGTLVLQMLRGQEDAGQPRRGDRRSPGSSSTAGGKSVSKLQAGQDQAAVLFTAAELQGGSVPVADADAPVAAAEPAGVSPPNAAALPAAPAQAASEQQQQQQAPAAAPEPVAPASSSEAEADAPADAGKTPPQPFSLVRKVALAGGMLHLVCLEGDRMLRIWLPPGYNRALAARQPYPVLLLNDGQNLFDDRLSFSGRSWRAGEAAAEAVAAGRLPPFLVVGVDHAGPSRSLEYLPYKPGTGPGGFRSDAASWPGGGVAAYCARVFDEVLPWVQEQYGGATQADRIAFGGSSFGGICALWACMHYGDRFGAALVESPSLWFADEKFLREDLASYAGPWPQRLFLAMGSREYGGTRPGPAADGTAARWDRLMTRYCLRLARLLRQQGLDADRLQWQIGLGAGHTESAWAQRLPAALDFLLAPWWGDAAARHAHHLFFTSPAKLQAGQPAVLFVNQGVSHPLAGKPAPLRVRLGFNNWKVAVAELELRPAPQLEAGQAPADKPDKAAGDGERVRGGGAGRPLLAATEGGEGAETGLPAGRRLLAASAAVAPAEAAQSAAEAAAAMPKWQAVPFVVPEKAYEMKFVLTDGDGAWDNNGGSDFYVRVKLPPAGPAAGQSASEARAAAAAAAAGSADEVAARSASKLFFTLPEVLVAGAPGRLFLNRACSPALKGSPNLKVHLGFNHWDLSPSDLALAPAELWQGAGVDWWATPPFQVPGDAFDMSFAFTDGKDGWENNEGHNYDLPVWRPPPDGAGAAPPRTIASTEVLDHAGGKLHVIQLSKRAVTDAASRESRWKEEKVLRVWTPPGFSLEGAPPGGWPVLYMCDGKNMFEDWLAHQGTAWQVGETAAKLIADGKVPPFVVVAVDSAGPMRSLNYLPYKPGTGVGNFRMDAERWPGGGCEGYMRRLVTEIMPLVGATFGTASDPARVAFGGGSFAGVTALYAAIHYPHVFGSVLAESPSLWIAEGRFLQDLWNHRGALPERLFLGCGTREYSATREFAREEIDALLLHYYHMAVKALSEAGGMRGGQRLRFFLHPDAGHHESAWAWRLPMALTFLLEPWWHE